MRESMSRPNSSVPSGNVRFGGRKRLPIPIFTGEYGAIRSANSAEKARTPRMAAPMAPLVEPMIRRQTDLRRPAADVPASIGDVAESSAMSAAPDARIDERIDRVEDDRDGDDDDREGHDEALDDRVIALKDRFHRHAPDPVPGK